MKRYALALFLFGTNACAVDPYLQSQLDGGSGGDATQDTSMTSDGTTDAIVDAGPDIAPLPQCEGGVCVPSIPNGWTGPLAVYDGPGTAPACPPSYPTTSLDGKRGLTAPNATCGCTCNGPNGGVCPLSDLTIYSSNACNNASCSPVMVASNCVNTPSCGTGNYLQGGTSNAMNASCTPSPTKNVPAPSWSANGRACGGATGKPLGCMGSDICVPATSMSFPRVCVSQSGDVACPTGYATKLVYYASAMDTRDCSTCTCGSASNVKCNGAVVTIYDANGCSGSTTTIALDNNCHSLSGITPLAVKVTTAPTASGGSCPAMGGTPIGQATPTGPTTICCAN